MRHCPVCGFESDSSERCPHDGATLIQRAAEPDLIGRVLKDTYQVRRKIGEGGFGAVYEGLQQPLDRKVAIKTLRPGLERNPDLVKRFFREARLLSQINHPHIVQVYDCGNTADGLFFLVMELLEGDPLNALVPLEGLSLADLAPLFEQICLGVAEAHRRGLVHRDLKPANVFVSRLADGKPQVKVLDFGLARQVGVDTNITQLGAVLGTPGYASPEQISGEMDPDARADIYALGAILHFLAAGLPPYRPKSTQSTQALLARQLAGPPEDEELKVLSRHPPALRAIILRALDRSPAQRFQTVAELRDAVATLAATAPRPRTAVLSAMPGVTPAAMPPTAPLPGPGTHPPLPRTAALGAETPPPSLRPPLQSAQSDGEGRGEVPASPPVAGGTKVISPREPHSQSLGGVQIVPRAPVRGSARKEARTGRRALLAGGAALALGGGGFAAQKFGLTKLLGSRAPITLGMSAAFSGPSENLGRGMRVGLETRLREANAAGETDRPLRLVPLDDGYEPDRTRDNMQRLLSTEAVLAVVGNVGTPTAAVALPMATAARTPFIGAFTGAALLRQDPPDRYVFNYRASYVREIAAMVHYFVKRRHLQPQRIAVFAQQDAFGDAGMAGVTKALNTWGLDDTSGVLRVGYARNSADVDEAVQRMVAARDQVDAIVLIATYRPAARFIDGLRKAGVKKVMASLSFVGSDALARELRERSSWVPDLIVTQVVPPPTSNASAVLTYREALRRQFPEEAPGFVSLEGYVVGSLVVEAINRCQKLDREGLVTAFESIRGLDLGLGVPIDFGPSDHDASDRVWGSVIGQDYQYQGLELG